MIVVGDRKLLALHASGDPGRVVLEGRAGGRELDEEILLCFDFANAPQPAIEDDVFHAFGPDRQILLLLVPTYPRDEVVLFADDEQSAFELARESGCE